MSNELRAHALVGFLEHNSPAEIAGLRTRFPDSALSADIMLGNEAESANADALLAVANAALTKATTVAEVVRRDVMRRMRLYSRLGFIGNLLGAGSSIGLVAAVSSDLQMFEMVTAGSAFCGSIVALLSQYIGNSGQGGVSITDAMAKLVHISRDLAEAQGSMEMLQAVRQGTADLETVIRKANGAVGELYALQMMLGLSPE
jgi:hypothetical protein